MHPANFTPISRYAAFILITFYEATTRHIHTHTHIYWLHEVEQVQA